MTQKTDRELWNNFWGNCSYEAWCEAYSLRLKIVAQTQLTERERDWLIANTENSGYKLD